MADHPEASFLFGSPGGMSAALGEGWSVEHAYAWAIGIESELSLPLPGDDATYRLYLTLHPLLRPGVVDAQRLSVSACDVELASFTVHGRQTIEVPLPAELTRGQEKIDLRFTHPDAIRPRDFKDTADARWLTLCFHAAGLVREADLAVTDIASDIPPSLAIIAGGELARQIAQVMRMLPALRGFAFRHIDADPHHAAAMPTSLDATEVAGAVLCWEQSDVGCGHGWDVLREALPGDCAMQRFATPRMRALWPFQGSDPRLVTEPELYRAGRYPFGDRLGANLANMSLPDDVIMLAYESMAEKEVPDLDRLLQADVARWREQDAANDVQLADFILDNFRTQRLHFAPPFLAGPLLRHIIDQLVAAAPIAAVCDSAALQRELDFLLAGYIGRREELPIDPHVARHFGLAWWRPGMRYRWFGNNWTFEDYALRYIRWTRWRP